MLQLLNIKSKKLPHKTDHSALRDSLYLSYFVIFTVLACPFLLNNFV